MKKPHWLVLFLALGLLLPLLGMLGRSRAQPVSAGTSPVTLQSPILGPFLDIWTGDGVDNHSPAVAYNSLHDEYLVVWYTEQGPNTWDVWARRVGGDGTLKSWFAVATVGGEKRWQPAVAYSPAQDEYLIVYTFEYGASDYDIRAKRVRWDGGWMSTEFFINEDSHIQWYPAVAYNSQDDEYLVVYYNEWADGLRDIAAQRVKASDGSLLSWANVATGVGERRFFPDVAYNATRNKYLIAYTLGGTYPISPTPELGDIYGKVAAANLDGVSGSSEIAICDDIYDKGFVSVAAGPDEYLVVWEDGMVGGSTGFDIYARRVSGTGTPQGPSGGFPIAWVTDNTRGLPDVAYGGGYGYLVGWQYYDPGPSSWDIYARYVMPGQDSAAGDEFAIDAGSNVQWSPAVACAPSGDCLVVEEDNWPGADYEIRGRFVKPHRVYLPMVLRNY